MLSVRKQSNRIREPLADQVFNAILFVLVTILVFVFAYPLYFVLVASFSNPGIVGTGAILFYPKGFTLMGYQNILKNARIWMGYRNTIFYVISGTITAVTVTILAAFSMSRRDLPGRNYIMGLYVFTMYFNGGLIPTYLVVKSLNLINNPLVLILLGAFSVYNMIIARTYFSTAIPLELQEAAAVDGCSIQRLFFSIVLPLSKPIIAVIALYVAVSHWNAYFNAMIYLQKEQYFPLQLVLRQILLQGSAIERSAAIVQESAARAESNLEYIATLAKYCVIVVSTIPIICVYPFLQKYFIKGVMIGALKG